MFKRLVVALLHGLLPVTAAAGPALTELETRWLNAAAPVLAYAQSQRLPLDVIVQPQPRPGDVPLAMAYVDGRCKLVLSMRGRPDGDDPEALLAGTPSGLRAVLIEAMAAHELAHCWRHVQGAWQRLPAGFVDPDALHDDDRERLRRAMRQARHEEAFADLVGLAWTADRHPALYAAVHAWFTHVRSEQPAAGAHHDTRDWLRRVEDPATLGEGSTPFEAASPAWRRGLDKSE